MGTIEMLLIRYTDRASGSINVIKCKSLIKLIQDSRGTPHTDIIVEILI